MGEIKRLFMSCNIQQVGIANNHVFLFQKGKQTKFTLKQQRMLNSAELKLFLSTRVLTRLPSSR